MYSVISITDIDIVYGKTAYKADYTARVTVLKGKLLRQMQHSTEASICLTTRITPNAYL